MNIALAVLRDKFVQVHDSDTIPIPREAASNRNDFPATLRRPG